MSTHLLHLKPDENHHDALVASPAAICHHVSLAPPAAQSRMMLIITDDDDRRYASLTSPVAVATRIIIAAPHKKDIPDNEGENNDDDHVSSEPIPTAVNKHVLIPASFGNSHHDNHASFASSLFISATIEVEKRDDDEHRDDNLVATLPVRLPLGEGVGGLLPELNVLVSVEVALVVMDVVVRLVKWP